MRLILTLVALLAAGTASAERLTLERMHADPALSGPGVRDLKVSPDGARVTFLRARPDDQYQLDLWEYNMKDKTTRRLVDSKALVPVENLSDAEKAIRERARTAALKGIISYSWSPDGKQILVPLAGNLYLVDLSKPDSARLVASGSVIDPKISPKGKYVSFVRNQNLFVIDLATGQERQLTTDGKDTIHNGEAEFVAQEEMGQHTGYYWAPDDSAIAFRWYDETPVPVRKRFEISAESTKVIDQRYPASGEANAIVGLKIVSPAGGEIRDVDLGANKDIYLVRANWSKDAKSLYFQRQSRDQKKLELIAVDAATLAQRPVLTESAQTWTTIHDDLRFLESGKGFIWSSERTGRNHLYYYSLDGKVKHPISKGEWGFDSLLAVDEKAGKVYVSSNKDAAYDKQVYELKLDGSTADKPKRITKADGWHDASFSKNGEVFVDTWSDPANPPQIAIRRPDGSLVSWIDENKVDESHPYFKYKPDLLPVEFGNMKSKDGQTLYYSMIKPYKFDANKKYPVYLSTYGGPHSQHVTRKWDAGQFDQYMAQQGYVVFRLDNRGSSRRERVFTDAIYRNLGKVEVEDQLTGIEWLGKQPFVDAKRIGVYGWSYGGFMTLRLLSQASDKIAAGVSGAPVTDWGLYDTHYTEQFMDRPSDNVEGYKQSNVFYHVDGLKSKLLLIHGMADDNVLFTNTTKMIDALVNRSVQFELMTYPGAKHGVSNRLAKRHVQTYIDAFFRKHLKPESN